MMRPQTSTKIQSKLIKHGLNHRTRCIKLNPLTYRHVLLKALVLFCTFSLLFIVNKVQRFFFLSFNLFIFLSLPALSRAISICNPVLCWFVLRPCIRLLRTGNLSDWNCSHSFHPAFALSPEVEYL